MLIVKACDEAVGGLLASISAWFMTEGKYINASIFAFEAIIIYQALTSVFIVFSVTYLVTNCGEIGKCLVNYLKMFVTSAGTVIFYILCVKGAPLLHKLIEKVSYEMAEEYVVYGVEGIQDLPITELVGEGLNIDR